MSTPITISLCCNGRQKDYEATFTSNLETLQFKVIIDNKAVCFEGNLKESFRVKESNNKHHSQVDKNMLDAVSEQLSQMFF